MTVTISAISSTNPTRNIFFHLDAEVATRNGFERHDEDVTAVENRNRHQVEEPEIEADGGHQREERDHRPAQTPLTAERCRRDPSVALARSRRR